MNSSFCSVIILLVAIEPVSPTLPKFACLFISIIPIFIEGGLLYKCKVLEFL